MTELFTEEYTLLWMVLLAAALFYPVRRIIWVMSVRRAERDGEADEQRRQALKKRATVTATLLVFIFSYFYTMTLFKDPS